METTSQNPNSNAVFELPALLDLPSKLLVIVDEFGNYRYFLVHGGRGGGKSQGVARMLLYLCEHHTLRVVCGRETQNSIEESVYTIFKDLIAEYNLVGFEVYSNKITHLATKSTIAFKGFREQGAVNIKGLEGVDILWIDESQAITKTTLDIIIPTIRKNKSRVIFTMNRYLKNDPVYKEFSTREDCLTIKINYTDNPFCSEVLLKEAKISKERAGLSHDWDDYNHIWLGYPQEEADNFLFSEEKLDTVIETDFLRCGYHETVMGVDVARYGDDKCVAYILQKRGPLKWQEKHVESWGKKNLMETTGRVMDLITRFSPVSTSIDADNMQGVVDRLGELGRNCHEFHGGWQGDQHVMEPQFYYDVKTECFYKLEDMIMRGDIEIRHPMVREQLQTIMYTHKSDGRKVIVSKEMMRNKGFKSPDFADAPMMAMHAIRMMDTKAEDEEDHRTYVPRKQPPEDRNLFKIAGYK